MQSVSNIGFLVIFSLFTISTFSQDVKCKLKGTVIGRNSVEILIVPITEDFNNIQFLYQGIAVPIKNNKFEYELKASFIEAYYLFFKEEAENGGFLLKEFFPDSSVVEITIYPDEQHVKNTFKGGDLNRLRNKFSNLNGPALEYFQAIMDTLSKNNRLYTKKYQYLSSQIRNTQSQKERDSLYDERKLLINKKERYTPEGSVVLDKIDSLNKENNKTINNYIRTNQNIYSYSLLYLKVSNNPDDNLIDFVKSVFPLFSKKYPSHPYTKVIEERLNTYNKIRIGGQFIDFKAPTIDEKLVTISDSIKGKVALIDLWSTWCGPCRTVSKSMIPLYEKFKDRGFTIIGVSGVYKNTDDFKNAIEKDKYPWLNLIEFNNQLGIWNKYGISGAGGATFLVDQTGKIIAISPNNEEVDKILTDLFK